MHKTAAWIALPIAVIACAIGIYGALRQVTAPDETAIENRVYRRIVAETWLELAPVYEDFGIKRRGEAKTVGDLIRPLLSIDERLSDHP